MAGGNPFGSDDPFRGPVRQQRFVADERAAQTEQELILTEDDARLPWLDDHDDDEDAGGVDTKRILIFAIAAFGLLLVVLGAVWFGMRDEPQAKQLPYGSVIKADPGPYKMRPAEPGGIEFSGTGDSAYRVAEGQIPKGRIAEFAPVPTQPVPEKADAAPAASSAAAEETPPGVGVQVGAYSSKAAAEAGWVTLINRFEVLQGRRKRIVQGVVDGSIVYRLQATAGSLAEADSLCSSLKAAGGDCQVKR